jgi:DNA-binding CsgD family transcriptional regulator
MSSGEPPAEYAVPRTDWIDGREAPMTPTVRNAADLSYELGELPGRDDYLAAAAVCLHAAVGGDVVTWNALDVGVLSADIWWDPPDANISAEATAAALDEHPLVRRYLANPRDLSPHRISDCLPYREWRSSRMYREVAAPMGAAYQLGIPVIKPAQLTARGWAINRSICDFTAANVTLARNLQPMLAILDRVYPPCGAEPPDAARRDEARRRAGLTPRELDVLALVAAGLSAHQISRLRRISVRTVRKHLEHIYAKLDSHDRLLAVNRAKRLGIL